MPEIVVPSTGDRLRQLAAERRGVVITGVFIAALIAISLAVFALNRPAAVAPPATASDVPPAPPVASQAPAGAETPPLTAAVAPGSILVHVDGAVRRPGLFSLPPGSRVADAVDAAGGPRPGADLRAVNLAEPLTDGQKLEVPKKGADVPAPAPVVPGPVAPSPGSSPAAMVNLNTADQAALETLPEVGPVTAAAILEYRGEAGSFSSVDQLLDVSGIGPATLEAIRPFVTV